MQGCVENLHIVYREWEKFALYFQLYDTLTMCFFDVTTLNIDLLYLSPFISYFTEWITVLGLKWQILSNCRNFTNVLLHSSYNRMLKICGQTTNIKVVLT